MIKIHIITYIDQITSRTAQGGKNNNIIVKTPSLTGMQNAQYFLNN